MASALYTDIKRWKAGIPGSVFCRCVTRPAAVAPRARAPPPRCRTRPKHVESLSRVVVRTDRVKQYRDDGFDIREGVSKLRSVFFIPAACRTVSRKRTAVSIVEISIDVRVFFFDRPVTGRKTFFHLSKGF